MQRFEALPSLNELHGSGDERIRVRPATLDRRFLHVVPLAEDAGSTDFPRGRLFSGFTGFQCLRQEYLRGYGVAGHNLGQHLAQVIRKREVAFRRFTHVYQVRKQVETVGCFGDARVRVVSGSLGCVWGVAPCGWRGRNGAAASLSISAVAGVS
jgi:hypothetical protein